MAEATYARASIAQGSKSFAAAARLLPAHTRDDVSKLYAWCRHCDDVIDGQVLGHGEQLVVDAGGKLADLRNKTDAALEGRATGEAVFDGFGPVARTHGITPRLAHDLLDGFQKDVAQERYPSPDALIHYCYGVAGSVGVMMALVLGVKPDDADTLDRACDLGLAFQMTNIARDVVADAHAERVYLPTSWLDEAGVAPTPEAVRAAENKDAVFQVASRLVSAAEDYYQSADVGVARLPFRSAWAIASASTVYRAIGEARRTAGPEGLATRARTTGMQKLTIIALSTIKAARRERGVTARNGLWQRPERP
ncbi:MAG: phytoene/squalene synthase family protein [Pseudomonadota bacterium]